MNEKGEETALGSRHRGILAALLVAASPLLASAAQAQQELPPAPIPSQRESAPRRPTSLESYLERPGILLVKQYHPLEAVELRGGGRIRLEAVAAHEPGMQHQRVMGIRAEIDRPRLAREERVFYIDVHEIEELVRAIHFMTSAMEAAQPARREGETEMSISTRDGLELGVRRSADGVSHFLRTHEATFPLRPTALETLRTTLEEGRKRLFSE